ncbi:MAG: hypothetical protein Q7S19_03955 [bacterium]|nr:hypothetical protein [bacterium]
MDYLKSLTKKQWLIILCVGAFLVVSYLVFFRKSPNEQAGSDLQKLLQQNPAPRPLNESLNRSEIDALRKQGSTISTDGEQPTGDLTKTQKDALLKLMSTPRK